MPHSSCPCCGYYTLGPGDDVDWAICDVCGWENNPFQRDNPTDTLCGDNGLSLSQARRNFRRYGTSDPVRRRSQDRKARHEQRRAKLERLDRLNLDLAD